NRIGGEFGKTFPIGGLGSNNLFRAVAISPRGR
ncbi:MAG: hypothetical protein JWO31_1888, partial [Phycisphaerales bacterium]|nr:hypothetical protein [Phycisphaerales bacterium]